MMVKTVVNVLLFFFFMFQGYSMACGPDFDDAYLVRAGKEKMYVIPSGDFIYELKSMFGKDVSFLKHDSDKAMRSSIEADVKLLEEALKAKALSPLDRTMVVDAYSRARQELVDYINNNYMEDPSVWFGGLFRAREMLQDGTPEINWMRLNKKTPLEFSIYLEGARQYYQDDFAGAEKKWNALLGLPKNERGNKSVWAAFMLGKAALNAKHEGAIEFFEMTRQLAKDGYKDPLDLASDSYGWQALAEFELKEYRDSIKHYLLAKDAASLVRVCSEISKESAGVLKKLVQDETARKVLLAWAVSRDNFYKWDPSTERENELKKFFRNYLSALESLKDVPVTEADKVAWIYYNSGDFKNARQWVDLTKLSTPLAKLIDARLVLRAGDVDGALKRLHEVVPSFEQSPDKAMFYWEDVITDTNSQIGVLKMARKEYMSAFETLLRGKYWEDIAYVAEKVLTTDELAKFLDTHINDPLLKVPVDFHSGFYFSNKKEVNRDSSLLEGIYYGDAMKEEGKSSTGASLAYLLARRYARTADWDKALKYYPKKESIWRQVVKKGVDGVLNYEMDYEHIDPGKKMIALRDHILTANNKSNDVRTRAKAFYEAGIVMRKYGMEIMGTELDPDSFVTRGAFSEYGSMAQRFSILHDDVIEESKEYPWLKEDITKAKNRREKLKKERDFFSGSEDEERRALGSTPDPNKRWHYRFKAADLMWKSAELLPDNDELKAKALCLGGTYLKVRDKQRANKFYKELIKTCGNTSLGKQANKLRWFPRMEE
jgi:tetratricopeptide (TPR) repeat protein